MAFHLYSGANINNLLYGDSMNGSYEISEITCVNGRNLTLVIDQNGKEYFKRREGRN